MFSKFQYFHNSAGVLVAPSKVTVAGGIIVICIGIMYTIAFFRGEEPPTSKRSPEKEGYSQVQNSDSYSKGTRFQRGKPQPKAKLFSADDMDI